MYDDYNEEEIERFGKEGGKFLLENEIVIDTDDLEEIRKFKRGIEEEEIKKIEGKRSFNIIKIRERSDNTMFDNYELEELVKEFNDEEIDEELEKALKVIPEKLKEALGECYKILNEFKEEIKDLSPELFSAIDLLARLATTGKPGLPSKYPYPKLKKSEPMEWPSVIAQLFGGIDRPDFEKSEIPDPTRENPFPSVAKAIQAKADKIEEIEDEMEQDSFDPYDRMA